MPDPAPRRLTRQALARNIAAARQAGLAVVGIAPDGTVLTALAESVRAPVASPAGGRSCDDILRTLTGSG